MLSRMIFLALAIVAAGARAQEVRTIVTVEGHKDAPPPELTQQDVMVYLDNQRMKTTGWEPVQSEKVGLQLWVLIDDGTDSSLGSELAELRKFVLEQPATTQVGVGYLRNGSVSELQKLTTDHELAAKAFRLPLSQPGASASPYLALNDLIKKWPAGEQAREVVMITSGIDPDYGSGPQNPYLDQTIKAALRAGIVVHSIYYGSAGHFGHSFWQINWGQNYLSQLADETGGEFFWLETSNPVSISPYLKELNEHFSSQHVLTFLAQGNSGERKLKVKTEVPHAMLVSPSKVYVPGGK